MRLGGPVFLNQMNPESWVSALKKSGYRAAYCPVQANAGKDEIQAYARAAHDADIIIAEVGAWSNLLDPDDQKRRQAVEFNKQQLALADEIGALCCVNISGSRGQQWDGPDPDNLRPETFEMVVATVRDIIDSVEPKRAYYSIEPMPWMFPDSPDSYNDLVYAIDRQRLGVHLDVVNWINCPRRYLENAAFIVDCFEKLAPRIVSVHAKDTLLGNNLTVHLSEARPGEGHLDYRTFLREMTKLGVDTPLMLEHLPLETEYTLAAQYLRELGKSMNINM